MTTHWRHGWVVDDDTGEVLREIGDVRTRSGRPFNLRATAARMGKVVSSDLDTGEQVVARPKARPAQGTLF